MANVREAANKLWDAMNKRDFETIRDALHPDFVYIGPTGEEAHGPEAGLVAGWQEHATGFPDMRIDVNSLYADGNVVVTQFSFAGTHQGVWAGIEPTGKRVEGAVCNVMEFKDGKLYRERDYLDTASVLSQLGVVDL